MAPQQKPAKKPEEKFQKRFENGIALLLELSKQGIPIAVEGIKDMTALRGLGVTGPIHTLAGHSIVSLADELADSERLLVLFDFDRRGEQLARQLTHQLKGRGVKLMQKERRQLRKAFCWHVRVIEGLKPLEKSPKGTKF